MPPLNHEPNYQEAGTDYPVPAWGPSSRLDLAGAARRFLLRPAVPRDLAYFQEWLPDALGGTPTATFTVATDAATGKVAGIAALRVFADRVGRFLLFVEPAARRRGCGTALLESVVRLARAAQATQMLTGQSADAAADDVATTPLRAFFRACGLAPAQEILRYRAALQTALALLEPVYRRYERGPASSRRARIVTADEVDPRLLAAFVVRDVGGIPEVIAARLTGHGPRYSLPTSMVALLGDRIVGALLTLTQGTDVLIETRAVDAPQRGSGINLALMYGAASAAQALGIRTIEFEHDTRERDTAKLARRLGATAVGRRQSWGCQVAVTAASGWQAEALSQPPPEGQGLKELQEQLFFDSVNDVIQVLHERGIGGMSVVNHVRGVTLQLKVIRHGPEAFARATGLKACLLFAALPKSASLYLFSTLAAGLSLDKVTVCGHRFPHEAINSQLAARLAVPGSICHTHADAQIGNLAPVNRYLDRMVVHVRDPRQAMLSAIHYLNDLRRRLGAAHVASFALPLPDQYFDLSWTKQIDWMIEHGLPEFVAWIQGWLEAAANPLFRTQVLFTRFEDLHAAPAAFFRSILDFYGAAWRTKDFQPPAPVSGSRHFRKGTTDEWRSALTPAQREAASHRLPARILERFGWPAL